MFLTWLLAAAFAADDPAVESPVEATADPRIDVLEEQLDALRAELDQMQQDALFAEAEAMAASTPPPTPAPQARKNSFNPAITAFGDLLTTVGVQDGAVLPGSGPWLRSLEFDVRADVDPFAKAVAILAIEQEPPLEVGPPAPGEEAEPWGVAPEEVYVDIVSLPAGFSARAGQFKQSFGITNRSHPHDWPWPDTPASMGRYLGEEGYADAGAQLSWTAPTSVTGLTFTAGAMRGALLDPEETTAMPEWIGRAEWFHDLGNVDIAVGGSGTGLDQDVVAGSDLMIRWKANSWRSVLFLGELFTDLDTAGGYGAIQVQPTRPLYLGLRGDYTDGEPSVGAYASVYTSEFLRLRGGATVGSEMVAANAQLTFVWGSHPVEPYWVNR